jgi:hypothetical protein
MCLNLLLRARDRRLCAPSIPTDSLVGPVSAAFSIASNIGVGVLAFVASIWAAFVLVQTTIQWFAQKVLMEMLKPRRPLSLAKES